MNAGMAHAIFAGVIVGLLIAILANVHEIVVLLRAAC